MELSLEKSLITDPTEGFEFLGYRLVRERSLRTGLLVAKPRIPKEKLQQLRDRLKRMTDRSTTGHSLEELLRAMNPILVGWRNYYRYATGAWKDFMHLDRWVWLRVQRWLRKKHPKLTSHEIRARYACTEGRTRWTWGEQGTVLKRAGACRTGRYLCRGTRISNGWNDEMDGVSFYSEVTRPISGFTWLGELLR